MIAIASDHGGFLLKEKIIKHLNECGVEYIDLGTHSEDSCDYPDYAFELSEAVASKKYECGILICGTGIGVSICANRVKGIRAAVCTNTTMAKLARQHNDANVLCIGARIIGDVLANEIIDEFLNTDFLEGRHRRRVDKINNY